MPQQKQALEALVEIMRTSLQTPSKSEALLLAVLQLCSRLTRNHELSLLFVKLNGLEYLLTIPLPSEKATRPTGLSRSSYVGTILRHIVEDPNTLQEAMESCIKSTVSTMSNRNSGRITTKAFLNALPAVVCRDPKIFLDAAANTCRIASGGANIYLAKQGSDAGESEADAEAGKENEKEKSESEKPAASSSSSSSAPIRTAENEATYKLVISVLVAALTKPEPQPVVKTEDSKSESEKETVSASASSSSANSTSSSAGLSASASAHHHRKVPKILEPPKLEFAPMSRAAILQLLSDFICSHPHCAPLILEHTFAPITSKNSPNFAVDNLLTFMLEEFVPFTRPPSANSEADVSVLDIINNESLVKHNSLATRVFVALCARPEGRARVVREVISALRRKTSEAQPSSSYYTYIRCVVDLLCIQFYLVHYRLSF